MPDPIAQRRYRDPSSISLERWIYSPPLQWGYHWDRSILALLEQQTQVLLSAANLVRLTYLPKQTRPHSRLTIRSVTWVSPLGARPHPPGPNAKFSVRRYLISGRYIRPSDTSAQIHYMFTHLACTRYPRVSVVPVKSPLLLCRRASH